MTLSAAPRISCEVIDTRAGQARIFNIQRYSLNDGQGIRTLVFFKGCPHRCPWCANPESISGKIETVRRENKCLHCSPCQRNAVACPSGAWEEIGRDISPDELLREVLKDDVFFRASGGGVTLSGGEVLMQVRPAIYLLRHLRQWGIPVAIETAGDAPWPRLQALAEHCDEVLFDLKIMDSQQAREIIRMNQPRVLDNFIRLVQAGITVIPRVPLIPGYTLTPDNMRAVIAFLLTTPVRDIHLLPFHAWGEPKYRMLGKPWAMAGVPAPAESEILAMKTMAENAGFTVTIGG